MTYIAEYLEMVKKESIHLMCKEQKKLVLLIESILKNEKENLYIDEERVEKYLTYQKYFSFNLFPWEVFLLVLMLCLYRKDTNEPRFSTLFCMVGRTSEVLGKMHLYHFWHFV